MATKENLWVYTVGGYGNRVSAQERYKGSPLYLVYWDPVEKRQVFHALGHRDRARAKAQAHRKQEQREAMRQPDRVWPLREVVDLYLEKHSKRRKGRREQAADLRRAELWTNVLGEGFLLNRLTEAHLEDFCDQRGRGVINARGERVASAPVGPRCQGADIEWLLILINFAVRYRHPVTGTYLLDENPVRGYRVPRELNPRRPVARHDVYGALLEAGGPGHFKDLLVLVHELGNRIEATCRLEDTDYIRTLGERGAVRWAADREKEGREWYQPVTGAAASLLGALCAARTGPLFPSPKNPALPMSRFLAHEWGQRAAKAAGVEWPGWHAFRRKWVSDRSHLPDAWVAEASGRKSIRVMKESYQHIDFARKQLAVDGVHNPSFIPINMSRGEVREGA